MLGKIEETVRARQQEALLERLRIVVHDASKLGLSAEALRVQFEQAIQQFFSELRRQGDKS